MNTRYFTCLLLGLIILSTESFAQGSMRDLNINQDSNLIQGLFKMPSSNKNEKFPLIVWLHGSGERGYDNRKQYCNGLEHLDSILDLPKYQAFVFAPQCPAYEKWCAYDKNDEVHHYVDSISKMEFKLLNTVKYITNTYPIDKNRIYLIGLSMGGFGVWDMLARFPGRFAAGIPICGGGDPFQAKLYCKTPIRAFHGKKDNVINPLNSINIVEAIYQLNCNLDIKLTLYPYENHGCWNRAIREPGLLDWLFKQTLH